MGGVSTAVGGVVITTVGVGVGPGPVVAQPAPRTAAARTRSRGIRAIFQYISQGCDSGYLRVVLYHKSVIHKDWRRAARGCLRFRSRQSGPVMDPRTIQLSKIIKKGEGKGVHMNLRRPNSNEALGTSNRSRNVVPMSGICTRCLDGCKGMCDLWLSSFRGREVLYPGPFGEMTAGADKDYPVDYSHINIQGYARGAKGLPEGTEAGPDSAVFSSVNTETSYGWDKKVKLRIPIFTGALGSTEIARKNWEHFAAGAAMSGITIVCGENVCGVDPGLVLDSKGKVSKSPEMDRRIETYRKFHEGYGELLVQMNVEDTRLGTAEYVSSVHNLDTIELKWGQGAKCIGGEIKVKTLEHALELKKRGYIVLPDPSLPEVQKGFGSGSFREFERHSRLGFVSGDGLLEEVDRLRDIGFSRVTLKTGAYSAVELAMALRFGSEARDRPPHHRRRTRRDRDEPLADDDRVGHPDLLPPVPGHGVREPAEEEGEEGARYRHGRRVLLRGRGI